MSQNPESPSAVCLIGSARRQGNSAYLAEAFTGQAAHRLVAALRANFSITTPPGLWATKAP